VSISEAKRQASQLEAEARAIAEGIVLAAREPGSGELAAINAATAQRHLRNAERRVALAPAAELAAHMHALDEFEDCQVATIEAAGATDAAVQQALARLDRQREGFELWLIQLRRDAWLAAHAALIELVRALNQESQTAE
jgi:hypothetical protein